MTDEKQIIEDIARAKEALQAVVDASGTPNNVDVVSFLVNLRDVALKVRVALAALSLDGLSGAGAGESNIVSMERTPGKWVYEQTTDAHGIYSETGAMLGEMWRGIDAKFVAAAPERIAALEREVADLRAALSLDGLSERKESEADMIARQWTEQQAAHTASVPLATAPAPVQVQAGMVMVPREPTEAMLDGMEEWVGSHAICRRRAWLAALAASPAAIPGDRK